MKIIQDGNDCSDLGKKYGFLPIHLSCNLSSIQIKSKKEQSESPI